MFNIKQASERLRPLRIPLSRYRKCLHRQEVMLHVCRADLRSEAPSPHRKQTECMMGLKMLLLAAAAVTLTAGRPHGFPHGGLMPGSLCNISRNDRSLQQVVLTAAYSYNNQSNDAFLFKPSAIHGAQRQIVKGIRYIVDLEISRTICRKQDNKRLSNCDFQPEGPLHQTFQCHFDIWMIPWQEKIENQDLTCKP